MFLAITPGYRESTESWSAVLRDLKKRGLRAPRLVVGDGHLGIWGGLAEVYPEAEEQRCWNHRMVNVLDKLPRKRQRLKPKGCCVESRMRPRSKRPRKPKRRFNAGALNKASMPPPSRGDDVNVDQRFKAQSWHPRLPDLPKDFPGKAEFALSREEAEFIQDQIQVNCSVASFIQKVWAIRFVSPDEGELMIRLVILTRNMTPDQSWDLSLQLEGTIGGRKAKGIKDEDYGGRGFSCRDFGRRSVELRQIRSLVTPNNRVCVSTLVQEKRLREEQVR